MNKYIFSVLKKHPASTTTLFLMTATIITACTPAATPSQPLANAPTTAYSATEIAAHNSPADCWVAANGQVYDITDFLAKHKSPLEKFCGQTNEFEQAYNAQHGNSKEDVLGAYQIGVLQ